MTLPIRRTMIALLLLCAPLLLHAGAWNFEFLNYDDPDYVRDNAMVARGLSLEGLRWAFGAHAANWHPLTWIAHMLDVSLYGMDAGRHHLSSLLLHGLNAALLFMAFAAATRRLLPSLCLALLHLLHPLQVESTLWIAERKDLLSASFALASLWAYVAAPARHRLWSSSALLLLGLLSKPMLVSWPFVLLLVDVWPLQRTEPLRRRVLEKWPMFAACAAVIALTIWAQRGGGAMSSTELIPFGDRLTNAVVAYGRYLQHWVWWSSDLVVSYPHPALVPAWGSWGGVRIALSGALLLCLGVIAWRIRCVPLRVGLAWWAGMLVPVIGLLQVGSQSLADRYMLLPSIGLGIVLCFAWPWRSRALAIALAIPFFVQLGRFSHEQGRVWANSESLFRHAVTYSQHNWLAWNNLGNALRERGAQAEALSAYDQALAIQPAYGSAHFNRANALVELRRLDEAEAAYRDCLRQEPQHVGAHNNLARVLLATGRAEAAVPLLQRALELAPDDLSLRLNLAQALHGLGRLAESAAILDPMGADPWQAAPPALQERARALRGRLQQGS